MPPFLSILTGLCMGYLDGAGLGAAAGDLLLGQGAPDVRIAWIAGLLTGPLGAILGALLAARAPEGGKAARSALRE
ncbi:MAG: hypothetical protein ACR652_16440 [Methylocystis sp.]|uniref:hypothetical protein n=1 Tax=Methylocystis sp. TaxID=1911079 RepID=UPI003DA5B0C5